MAIYWGAPSQGTPPVIDSGYDSGSYDSGFYDDLFNNITNITSHFKANSTNINTNITNTNNNTNNTNNTDPAVPEPTTLSLLTMSLLFAGRRWR